MTAEDIEVWFSTLADHIGESTKPNHTVLLNYAGERSDFIRFNNSAIRQPGSVRQHQLTLRLIEGKKQISADIVLTGRIQEDTQMLAATRRRLEADITHAPEDPYTTFNPEVSNTRTVRSGSLPENSDVLDAILGMGKGQDMVGLYAGGTQMYGFANSMGQRNWHQIETFNLDWSFYLHTDKAVKDACSGTHWDIEDLKAKRNTAIEKLRITDRTPITLAPGAYRVYLAPAALEELMSLLGWGGFSASRFETGQSPLQKLKDASARLDPRVTMVENTAEGAAPPFQADGFIRPTTVTFLQNGEWKEPLVSPRSAVEFHLKANGANTSESPLSLDMQGGDLKEDQIYSELGTGIYITNLWYANFSDRYAGRITGMTRFASHWVKDGQPIGPINPLRFDDSILDLLGKSLVKLTSERDFLMDPGTYGSRSSRSLRLPGALVDPMTFTL